MESSLDKNFLPPIISIVIIEYKNGNLGNGIFNSIDKFDFFH